jgi:hypothetical protein
MLIMCIMLLVFVLSTDVLAQDSAQGWQGTVAETANHCDCNPATGEYWENGLSPAARNPPANTDWRPLGSAAVQAMGGGNHSSGMFKAGSRRFMMRELTLDETSPVVYTYIDKEGNRFVVLEDGTATVADANRNILFQGVIILQVDESLMMEGTTADGTWLTIDEEGYLWGYNQQDEVVFFGSLELVFFLSSDEDGNLSLIDSNSDIYLAELDADNTLTITDDEGYQIVVSASGDLEILDASGLILDAFNILDDIAASVSSTEEAAQLATEEAPASG